MARLEDLKQFYGLLDRLEEKVGKPRILSDCHGRMDWPDRGVYFFFEPGEMRSDSGTGLRVVRVGTHALIAKSRTSLWNRLSQHRGVQKTGSGNHRGSIFRLVVGAATKCRDGQYEPISWGVAGDPGAAAKRLDMERTAIRDSELVLEKAVSRHIGNMPFLWLDIGDPPGPDSLRGMIERNSISLLSNHSWESLDPSSPSWLGHQSDRDRVRHSGLWNNNHVDDTYDPRFLVDLEQLIDA